MFDVIRKGSALTTGRLLSRALGEIKAVGVVLVSASQMLYVTKRTRMLTNVEGLFRTTAARFTNSKHHATTHRVAVASRFKGGSFR